MINRRRLGGRACIVATVLGLVAGITACSDDATGPSTSPPATATPDRSRGPNDNPGATTPPGTGPTGTLVRNVATGLTDGWNVVATAPERYTNDNDALLHDFGQDVSMAFGSGGLPVVAWASLTDSANNGYTISSAELVPNVGWAAPVEVTRARMAPGPTARLFSMAGNATSGVIAIAFERHDDNGLSTGIDVSVSTDRGRSWVRTAPVDGEAYHPAIAVGTNALFVAYVGAEGYAISTTALPPPPRIDPPPAIDTRQLSWTTQTLPGLEGYGPTDRQPAIALDPAGRPMVATLLASTSANRRAVAYVDVGSKAAVKAVDVDDVAPGSSSVALAFRGASPVVATAFEPRPAAGVLAYVATSNDGGVTFSSPSLVPTELRERAPFGVGLTVLTEPPTAASSTAATAPATTIATPTSSRTVLVYQPDTFDPAPSRCGLPRLVSSADLTTWSTCGAGTETATPATAVWPANLVPVAGAGPDGHLYVPVTNRNPSARVPLGIVLWREP